MTVKVATVGLRGMEGYRVLEEVKVMHGKECIVIVGLLDASVKEAKERVKAAMRSCNYQVPDQKVVINLSPSEQRKNGPMFDLAIAVGLLGAMGVISVDSIEDIGFIGALSLDGNVHPVTALLPAILAARKIGFKKLYIPFDPSLPQLEFNDSELIYVSSLKDVLDHLAGHAISPIFPLEKEPLTQTNGDIPLVKLEQIVGHTHAKRAMEIAAAGGHHVLMIGPPGSGKSMLAESFPSIFPPLSIEEKLEAFSLHHLSGIPLPAQHTRPFRSPHHSASCTSIIGGGQYPKPGEISLAHHGILFLDEIAEFPKKTLDMLRQPIETGVVTISRTNATITYPAQFTIVGAMNPCKCGYLGSDRYYCSCSPSQISSYQNKLSGPIRDRFDVFLELHPINLHTNHPQSDSSEKVLERVEEARYLQYKRYKDQILNARVPYHTLQGTSPLCKNQQQMLRRLSFKHHISSRAQVKIIRLARTISDLENSQTITDQSIWEAIKLQNRKQSNVTWKNEKYGHFL